MNTSHRLFSRFIASLLLHGITLFGLACLWSNHSVQMIPAFQSGEFSVELSGASLTPASPSITAESLSLAELGQALTDSGKAPPAITPAAEDPEEMLSDSNVNAIEQADAIAYSAAVKPTATKAGETEKSPLNDPVIAAEKSTPHESNSDNTSHAQIPFQTTAGAANPGVPGMPQLGSYIRPIYPPGARLRGEEGTVIVRTLINAAGKAQSTEIMRSSGYPALDHAAVSAVCRAQFIPARKHRIPVESPTTLTFRFTLVD